MAKKKAINEAALLKAISEKVPQKDIMRQFGFNTSTQLKVAYANALMNAGMATEIFAGRSKKSKSVDTRVKINSRGSLTIPKVLVESMGFEPEAEFEVSKFKGGMVLKPAEPKQKVIIRKKAQN